jgi:hypothetical protein
MNKKLQSWDPHVGMKIRYRRDVLHGKCADPDVIATVLSVHDDGTIEVRRNKGKRREVFLRKQTWRATWEPANDEFEAPTTKNNALNEAAVRRIVREELDHRFRGIESAMRNFLDELFNTTN